MTNAFGDLNQLTVLAELLKTIAHPARLCILAGLLKEGESNVSNMQHCMVISQSNISQHLSKMRSQGILVTRREGNEVYYRVANEKMEKILKVILNEFGF